MFHHAQHAKKMPRWKKVVGSAVGISVLMASGAYAYFDLDSSGNGYVTVQPASPWVVTVAPPTGGYLAPGSGVTDTDNITVINNGSAAATLNTITYVVTTDANGGVFDTITQAFVDTCKASWFNVIDGDGGIPLPHTFSPGAGLTAAAIFVSMPADSVDNESSCMGLNPQVTISVT